MLNTILNLISIKLSSFTVSLRLVLSTVFIILIGIIAYQSNKLSNLNEQLVVVEYRLSSIQAIYTDEITKAKDIINKQNTSIKQISIDKEYYESKVKQKEKELRQYSDNKKNTIIKNLEQDSSTENQLNMITQILKDFSNENN